MNDADFNFLIPIVRAQWKDVCCQFDEYIYINIYIVVILVEYAVCSASRLNEFAG